MPQQSPSVHLIVTLPIKDYTIYTEAVRLLTRIMGKKAPNPITLIVHTLCRREARGLVEDYLEAVGWPLKLRKPHASRHRTAHRSHAEGRRTTLSRDSSVDPSRN